MGWSGLKRPGAVPLNSSWALAKATASAAQLVYKASDWAAEALRWAVEKGVLNGKGGGILDPGGEATRAETAQMLKNFLENK